MNVELQWLSELGDLGVSSLCSNNKSWGARHVVQILCSPGKSWLLGVPFLLQIAKPGVYGMNMSQPFLPLPICVFSQSLGV